MKTPIRTLLLLLLFTPVVRAQAPTEIITGSGGGGTPCTTTALSLQFNNAGALGCAGDFTFAGHTITSGASGIFDLSAGNLKIPQAGAFASTVTNSIGYDTTNKNWHLFGNAVDNFAVVVPVAATVNSGNCPKWSVVTNVITLIDSGAVCGTVTGSNLTNGQLIFGAAGSAIAVGNLSGDVTTAGSGATTLAAIAGSAFTATSPAAGQVLCWPTASTTGNCWIGVTPNAQTGTTYTFLTTDRNDYVTGSNAGATAWTLPQAGSAGFASNFGLYFRNLGAGLITITPTTSTINGAATQIVPQNWYGHLFSDNTNYFAPVVPTIAAFPDCGGTGSSTSQAIGFTAATGAFNCNSIVSGGAITLATSVTVPKVQSSSASTGTILQVPDTSSTSGTTGGTVTVRTGDLTGATGVNVGGLLTLRASDTTSSNSGASSGGVTIRTGRALSGAAAGPANGALVVAQTFVKGTATTTGLAQCMSADNTVADCATSATNAVGVAIATNTNATDVQVEGIVTVNFPSASPSAGWYACTGTLNAGVNNIAVSSTACTAGQQVGIVTKGGTTVTSTTILLQKR